MTLPALQLHAEDLHVRAPNTPAPASMMQEGMEHLYAAPGAPGSSELDEERGHGGENGGGATQPSRLPLPPATAPPPRYGSKPDQQSVARLFELLPKRDRNRFGKWALDHMVSKALPGELSRNGAITLVPLDGFEWADLRAVFHDLGILVGNQDSERTRGDGRTPRVWIESPQPTDPAQQLLDPPVSDFRTVALAWIEGEVRSLRSATP